MCESKIVLIYGYNCTVVLYIKVFALIMRQCNVDFVANEEAFLSAY